MLRSYQALTGYSAEELALLERTFSQSTEVLQNAPSQPEGESASASAGKAAATELGAGRRRDTASALVQGSFSFGGGGAPIELGAGSLALAWSHRFGSLRSLLLGSRVLGGAAFGRYRSPMLQTDGEEAARDGTARLPFYGAFGKLDAEVASKAPVLNLAGSLGLRGGWSHQSDVQSDADQFVWGPAAGVRGEYTFVPGYRLLLELELWAQRTPVFACPIDCNGPAEHRPSMWQAWLGFALGVGVDL